MGASVAEVARAFEVNLNLLVFAFSGNETVE